MLIAREVAMASRVGVEVPMLAYSHLDTGSDLSL